MKTLSNALVAQMEALMARYGQMLAGIPSEKRTTRQWNDLRLIKRINGKLKKMQ